MRQIEPGEAENPTDVEETIRDAKVVYNNHNHKELSEEDYFSLQDEVQSLKGTISQLRQIVIDLAEQIMALAGLKQ